MKIAVRRRYYWGRQLRGDKEYIHRFSSLRELTEWLQCPSRHMGEIRYQENSSFNSIRKINRKISAGESIQFPVEV